MTFTQLVQLIDIHCKLFMWYSSYLVLYVILNSFIFFFCCLSPKFNISVYGLENFPYAPV